MNERTPLPDMTGMPIEAITNLLAFYASYDNTRAGRPNQRAILPAELKDSVWHVVLEGVDSPHIPIFTLPK